MAYTHAAQFQTQLEMGIETTYGVFCSAPKIIQTTDEPDVSISSEANETPVVSGGTSEPQSETYVQGRQPNTAKWSARYNNNLMKLCLSSLCQVSTFSGSPFTDTFVPFTSYPANLIGWSIQKVYGPSASPNAARLLGAICKSVKISSATGQGLMIETEWQGKGGSAQNTVTPSSSRFNNNGAYAHTAFASGFSIGGVQMNPTKFDITIASAGGGAFYGTSQAPEEVALGPLSIKGSFTVSARAKGLGQIASMLAGTWQVFALSAGASTTAMTWAGDALLLSETNSVEDGFEVMTYNFALAKSATAISIALGGAAAFVG